VSELDEPFFELPFEGAAIGDERRLSGQTKIAQAYPALLVAYKKDPAAFAEISHNAQKCFKVGGF
jgi:hypothetical protein